MDRWNAEQLAQQLQSEDGLPVTYFPQTISNFTGPAKEFEKLVLSGELRHGGNPVLRWMADNVSVYRDANENIRPDKAHSSERIDGIVAAIMGIGSMMLTPATASGSLFVC
jgi:phage terminase large subunit-like protein